MSFSLSQADRDLLNQTIAKVNALTLSKKQGEQKNQKTKDHTYVELSENVLDAGNPTKFWYGVEVGFNEDGDPVAKPQGRIWDINSKSLVILGAPAVDDVVRIEPTSLDNEEPVWIGNKTAGGGGDSLTWIKTDADETDAIGTGTVYPFRGSLDPIQEGDPLVDKVVAWQAPDVDGKGTIKAGNWFCCTEHAGIYYPINIPVVL